MRLIETILAADADLYLERRVAEHVGGGYVGRSGQGLPVGYLTSQVFGNFYLSGLDHFIKRELKVEGYLRYMDNGTLFGDSPAQLRGWLRSVQTWLREERGLALREERVALRRCTSRVQYLGYGVSRDGHQPGPKMLRGVGRVARQLLRARTQPQVRRLELALSSYRGMFKF